MGVEPCQYVKLQSLITSSSNSLGELISKPYHPISLDSDLGFVDFLIKIYDQSGSIDIGSYGKFSNHLKNLEKGQVVHLTGPYGNIRYKGDGFFEIR